MESAREAPPMVRPVGSSHSGNTAVSGGGGSASLNFGSNTVGGLGHATPDWLSAVGATYSGIPGVAVGAPAVQGESDQLEDQLSMAENRAQALREKILKLESELNGPGASSGVTEEFLRITVEKPLDGARLGLAVKDLKVASITDPRA